VVAENLVECVQLGLLELIIKTQEVPDVALANNYHGDYRAELSRLRHIYTSGGLDNAGYGGTYRDWEKRR
jgi:hypothetical protein